MIKTSISVIIPVYNAQDTIERAVKSVLDTAGLISEIIVVDDGSDDRTPQILKLLASEHPQIRLFAGGHKGVSAARNTGINNAKGEWITFLDSDDYIETSNISAAAEYLTHDTDMVVTQVTEHRKERTKVLERRKLLINDPCKHPGQWLSPLITGSVWANFYRRDILTDSNISFCEQLSAYEDLFFNISYLKSCRNSLAAVPVSLYHYFVNSSFSEKTFLRRDMAVFAAFEMIFGICTENEHPYVRLLYTERLIRAMRHLIMLTGCYENEYAKLRSELSTQYLFYLFSRKASIKMKLALLAQSVYPYKMLH
ncbi:MAG: glycosyltransferase family 2 protein [Oscillospiraceae bacterium]|nr:glycosyltransferase family 2 protein [Oscillospiraceae bacterium]